MIDIKTIAVPKNSSDGGATTIINNVSGSGSISGHNLWGQYFDGTQDLTSSITVQGNVTAEDGNFVYVNAPDGNIVRINGDLLTYNSGILGVLNVDNLNAKKATIDDLESIKGFISNFSAKDITTENLTVTKQAHFFELVIDKIKSVGGQMIMTAANCVADYVKAYNSSDVEVSLDSQEAAYYNIYFLANDPSGRSIENDWQENDQALCQSFNNVSTGVNYDVSNKYYWRLVKGILPACYMNLNTGAVNNNPNLVTKNSVTISNPRISYDVAGTTYTENTDWVTTAQTSTELDTGVTWNQTSGGAGEQTVGTMETTNTIFGIKLVPIVGSDLAQALPDTFSVNCSTPARLNIAVNYDDDTYEYFKAPDTAQSSYTKTLNTETHIKSVIITNADEIEWHRVHGIKLSNLTGECDLVANADSSYNYSNIPSKGDNIVQLGYRYQMDPTYPTGGTAAQIKAWIESNPGIYDRAAAQIISTYKSPDTDVRPPAYAQYTGINDFNLTNHRGTYIDATGGYFKGKLVTESGNEIAITDQGLAVDVEFYKIVPEYNVITIDTNSQINPSNLVVNFLVSGNSTLSSTVPTNCAFTYSIDGATATSIAAGNNVSINISSMTASSNIVMNLFKGNELVDNITMRVTDIQAASGAAGKNGQFTQYAYKNATSQPSAPSTSTTTYPPTGWTATPTTPDFANGYYTWCTTRTVSYDTSNNISYGAWSTPYRITGDNGAAGEDGDMTEFIYTRNNGDIDGNPSAPAAPPHGHGPNVDGSYPKDWSGTDYNGTVWTDNPQGVGDPTISGNYKYEYISSREYDGSTRTWGDYATPSLWSNWGEKGQDGDGYEYIYKLADVDPGTPVAPHNPTYDEDIPVGWTDDPQGVSSTIGETKEWVSMRKKTNGIWGAYSAAALWAQYVPPGTVGPQGPQGDPGNNGVDAEYDMLVPVREQFEVQINTQAVGSQKYENITGKIYTYLRYAVAHVKGTNVTYLTSSELATYKLNIRPYNNNSAVGESGYQSFYGTNRSTTTINGVSCGILYYNRNNLLEAMWPTNTNYQNYYWLCENNKVSNSPTSIIVTLVKTVNQVDTNVDAKTIQLIFRPSNLFSVTDTALNSIYQGLTGNTDAYSATGMSAIKQSWDQISSRVTNIENAGYVNQSQVTQTANQIASQVVAQYSDAGQVAKTVQLDLTGLSTTTFYPVSVSLNNTTKPQRITVSRPLNTAYGSVDYGSGYPNDTRGFSLTLDLETIACGWGANWSANPTVEDDTTNKIHYYIGISQYEPIFIGKYEVGWSQVANNIPKDYIAGDIQQNWCRSLSNNAANDEIIYLRGGSKYDVGCSWSETTITLHENGYHWESARQSDGWKHVYDRPVISDWSTLLLAEQDEMKKSEIIQTANNIQLNVYNKLLEKTGIDITNGLIILNADNTTINGSLKINNATDGVVVYNDQNQKAVEVVRDSIGTFGTSQNSTTTYTSGAGIYTYIVGDSSYRQYISSYDTTAGYVTEDSYRGRTTRTGTRIVIGRAATGTQFNFAAGNITWNVYGYGGYRGYYGDYAYNNDNIYSSVGNCKVRFRIHALYGDNEWPYDSGWITPSFDTSTNKFSNSSAFSYTVTAGNNNADFELWIDWKGDNPIISGNDRYKYIGFKTTAIVTNTVSINTKIGTDGMRTITNDGLFWTNDERTTMARLSNGGIYGTGFSYSGYNVDETGPNKLFGSALNSMENYNNVYQLVSVSGDNTSKDRKTGYIKYNFDTEIIIDNISAWRYEFCYNYNTYDVLPAYVDFTGVGGSYPDVDPVFTFTYKADDNLPRGLVVTIINRCGRTLHIAAHRSLPQNMIAINTNDFSPYIDLSDGSSSSFIHLGGGYYKQLNLN